MKEFFEEISKYLFGPLLAAGLTYWFGIRGKRKDTDMQRVKELNIVLSNMLDAWLYLIKLNSILEIFEIKENGIVFPPEYLSFFVIKSGTLNENSLLELDKSIISLKQYDPITYFELEGIGKGFNFIKENYVLPFLNSYQKNSTVTEVMSRTFLDRMISDMKDYMKQVAKLISKDALKQVNEKIEKIKTSIGKEFAEEYNKEYYSFIIKCIPAKIAKPTYEEFKKEITKPEIQKMFKEQFNIMIQTGIDKMIALITQNPNVSIEEVQKMINESKFTQQ